MRAYYFDNLPGDQRLPHCTNPPHNVDLERLKDLGVLHWRINVEDYETKLNEIAKARDYKNRDTIDVSRAGMGEVSISPLIRVTG